MPKWYLAIFSAACLVCISGALKSRSPAARGGTAETRADAKPSPNTLGNLRSPTTEAVDRAIDAALDAHKRQVEMLLPIVDPDNAAQYSDRTRAAAAFLLGEWRVPEAAPALAQSLARGLQPVLRPWNFRINRLDAPYWTALVKIGRPAVPALLGALEQCDDDARRFEVALVMDHVLGGRRHAIETLEKFKGRCGADEQGRQRAVRLAAAVDDLRARVTEPDEPPY